MIHMYTIQGAVTSEDILDDQYESGLSQMSVPTDKIAGTAHSENVQGGGHFKNPSLLTPFCWFCNGRLNLTT